jgi:hypothetical protein
MSAAALQLGPRRRPARRRTRGLISTDPVPCGSLDRTSAARSAGSDVPRSWAKARLDRVTRSEQEAAKSAGRTRWGGWGSNPRPADYEPPARRSASFIVVPPDSVSAVRSGSDRLTRPRSFRHVPRRPRPFCVHQVSFGSRWANPLFLGAMSRSRRPDQRSPATRSKAPSRAARWPCNKRNR